MRFKLLAGVYLLLLLIYTNHTGEGPLGDVGDVFLALASLLVFAVIALWPSSTRTERVDRAMSGTNWGDRIEFDEAPQD